MIGLVCIRLLGRTAIPLIIRLFMTGRGHGPVTAFNPRAKGAMNMSANSTYSVEWDGRALIGWVSVDGALTKVTADRDTIHCYAAGFNDAVAWEIERHREHIFERLIPFLTGRARNCATS